MSGQRQYRLRIYLNGERTSDAWMPVDSWEEILADVQAFYRLRDEQRRLKPECTAQVETRAHGPAPWERYPLCGNCGTAVAPTARACPECGEFAICFSREDEWRYSDKRAADEAH